MKHATACALLIAAALVAGGVAWMAYVRSFYGDVALTDRALTYAHLSDGVLRIGLTTCDEPISYDPQIWNQRRIEVPEDWLVVRTAGGARCRTLVFANGMNPVWEQDERRGVFADSRWRIRISPVAPEGAAFSLTSVRLPFWPLPFLLGAYPALALPARWWSVRRGRRRRGLCPDCAGGLATGGDEHCPDCGPRRPIRRAIAAAFTLALAVSGGMWVLSYVPRPPALAYQGSIFSVGTPYGPGGWRLGVATEAEWRFITAGLEQGMLTAEVNTRDARAVPGASSEGGFGSFNYRRRVRGPYRRAGETLPSVTRDVELPLWAPTLVLAVVPLFALIRGPMRRRRLLLRREGGLCVHCAYDLTGNVTGICPECGEAA